MYHALLIIHLTSAIVWVGAVFMGTFIDWPVIRAASGGRFPIDFIVGQGVRVAPASLRRDRQPGALGDPG